MELFLKIMTNPPTKYQHIIPAWYISGFSLSQKGSLRDSLIYYYDTRTKKILQTKASNILWEDWYFEIDFSFFLINKSPINEGELINLIEREINGLESAFIWISKKIQIWWSSLLEEDKNLVIHYALHIFMRSKRKREEIENRIKEQLEEKYWINFTDLDAIKWHKDSLIEKGFDPNWLDKYLTKHGIGKLAQMVHSKGVIGHLKTDPWYEVEFKRFSAFTFHFIRLTDDQEFISSDNPVVIWKRCILFPIDKKTCMIGSVEKINLTVDFINTAIASSADNIIFSSNEELLEKYVDFLYNRHWWILMHLDKEVEDSDFQKIFELVASDYI